MKKIIILLILVTTAIQYAHAVLKAPIVQDKFLAEEEFELAYTDIANAFETIHSTEYFEEVTGRKPKFQERLVLKHFQRKVRRKLKKIQSRTEAYNSTECDLIVLRNGEEVEAKILEIDATIIKYKACSNPDGPIYSLNKSEVFIIKYINGTKEVISTPTIPDVIDNDEPDPETDTPYDPSDNVETSGAYLGGFILGLITLPLALIFGLFIGNKHKRKAYYEGWYAALGIYIIIALIALLA